jgi:predicted trehalose synthase
MMTQTPLKRRSAGYSLDEAARIGQAIRERHTVLACPRCYAALRHAVDTSGVEAVWLIRCDVCERSVVIRDTLPCAGQERQAEPAAQHDEGR